MPSLSSNTKFLYTLILREKQAEEEKAKEEELDQSGNSIWNLIRESEESDEWP